MTNNIENLKKLLINKGYYDEEIKYSLNKLEKELNDKKYGLVWEDNDTYIYNNLYTLIELAEKEIKTDNSKPTNMLIEGDNLLALNSLLATHKNYVNVCYIDPPYNTKKSYLRYSDNFYNKNDKWKHSAWLSFMSKRLYLAKELLSEDGLIFISIDENEFAHLKLLCDEVFGEENFIENFIWVKNSTKNNSKTTSTNHEYILCYCKNISIVKKLKAFRVAKEGVDEVNQIRDSYSKDNLKPIPAELEKLLRDFYNKNKHLKGISQYKFVDDNFEIYRISDMSDSGSYGKTYDIIHPITNKPCKISSKGWRYAKDTMDKMLEDNLVYFGKDETTVPQEKRYLKDVTDEVVKSVYISNAEGKKELQQMFHTGKIIFNNPKPIDLIKFLLKLYPNKNAVILDFFAGSGTTGHAVLELNSEDSGNREFILCTNNENNICEEITYQRLSKAINGYITDKGKEVIGTGGNLKYYKIEN